MAGIPSSDFFSSDGQVMVYLHISCLENWHTTLNVCYPTLERTQRHVFLHIERAAITKPSPMIRGLDCSAAHPHPHVGCFA